MIMSFAEWMEMMHEDFHQGVGALGTSLPLPPKSGRKKVRTQTLNPQPMNIDRGQGVQGTRRDDGNG
jgi:hypothetical protein